MIMIICKYCNTPNHPATEVCIECREMLPKMPIPNTLVAENRPIPSTYISESSSRRSIPDTVVSDSQLQPIPSTIISQVGEKRPIPDTVVSNRPMEGQRNTGDKRVIPNTIVGQPIERNYDDTPPPAQPISTDSDVFTRYDKMVSSIITDPEGFDIQEHGHNSSISQDVSLSQISVCSYCHTENPIYNKKCQVCDNPLPGMDLGKAPENDLFLVQLRLVQKDKEKVYHLSQQETIIGRDKGHIVFPAGKCLSSVHAKIYYFQDRLAISDLGSLNGTYLRLQTPYLLNHGDVFSIGQQLFQFQNMQPRGSIVPERKTQAFLSKSVVLNGKLVYFTQRGGYDITLVQSKTILGREQGNLIFTHDDTLSSPHVEILQTKQGYALRDLGSKNGTWIRIKRPTLLKNKDMIRIGEYIFLVSFPT